MNTAYSHQRKWPCRGHLDLTVARFYRVTSCGHRGRKSRLLFANGRHTRRRIDVANELEHAARRGGSSLQPPWPSLASARARLLTHSPFKLSLGLPASATSLSTAGSSRLARHGAAPFAGSMNYPPWQRTPPCWSDGCIADTPSNFLFQSPLSTRTREWCDLSWRWGPKD